MPSYPKARLVFSSLGQGGEGAVIQRENIVETRRLSPNLSAN